METRHPAARREMNQGGMNLSTGIRKALALSIVPFALLVILSAFPLFHEHECDAGHHGDCAACVMFHTAIVLTAVFALTVFAPFTGEIRLRSASFESKPEVLDLATRAPPLLAS
jgi:hypothetical protein